MSKKTWTPFFSAFENTNNNWKWIRNEKVTTPQNKSFKKSKNKPLNTTKASSQTPKNFLVCCFVVIKVPKMIYKNLGGVVITL